MAGVGVGLGLAGRKAERGLQLRLRKVFILLQRGGNRDLIHSLRPRALAARPDQIDGAPADVCSRCLDLLDQVVRRVGSLRILLLLLAIQHLITDGQVVFVQSCASVACGDVEFVRALKLPQQRSFDGDIARTQRHLVAGLLELHHIVLLKVIEEFFRVVVLVLLLFLHHGIDLLLHWLQLDLVLGRVALDAITVVRFHQRFFENLREVGDRRKGRIDHFRGPHTAALDFFFLG